MSNFFTPRVGGRGTFDTNESCSYSDDDSHSYDSLSFYSDEDSRDVPPLADLIPLPGIRATAEDLDRLIDDYLDRGLSKYIDKGTINKLFNGGVSSLASNVDDDTDFMSALSLEGSTIQVNRVEAEDTLTKMSTVTPSYLDDSTRSKMSQASLAAAASGMTSSMPHKVISMLKNKAEKGHKEARQFALNSSLAAQSTKHSGIPKSTKSTKKKDVSRATSSKSEAKRITESAKEITMSDYNCPLTPGADDILEDLRLSKDTKQSISSNSSDAGSISLRLKNVEDGEEEIMFEQPGSGRVKPDRLWGGLSLWEKLPIRTVEATSKGRRVHNRVTFAETPEIHEGKLWGNSMDQLEQTEIVDIINNLSMKNEVLRESRNTMNDSLGNKHSDSVVHPDLDFIRTPLSPAVLEDCVLQPNETQVTPKRLNGSAQTSHVIKQIARSPLFPSNKSPSCLSSRRNIKAVKETSKMSAPKTLHVSQRAEEIVLTPPHAPFSQAIRPVTRKSLAHSLIGSSIEHVPSQGMKSAGKSGLRQRAQSRIELKEQSVQALVPAVVKDIQAQKQTKEHSQDETQVAPVLPVVEHNVSVRTSHIVLCERADDGSEVELCLEKDAPVAVVDVHSKCRRPSALSKWRDERKETRLGRSKARKEFNVIPKSREKDSSITKSMAAGDMKRECSLNSTNGLHLAGSAHNDPGAATGNIEAVLSKISLYDSEGNKVNNEGTITQRSFQKTSHGMISPLARHSHHPATPIKIGMVADSVEMEGRFPDILFLGDSEKARSLEIDSTAACTSYANSKEDSLKTPIIEKSSFPGRSGVKQKRSLPNVELPSASSNAIQSATIRISVGQTTKSDVGLKTMDVVDTASYKDDFLLATAAESKIIGQSKESCKAETFLPLQNPASSENEGIACQFTGDASSPPIEPNVDAMQLISQAFTNSMSEEQEKKVVSVLPNKAATRAEEPQCVATIKKKLTGLLPVQFLSRVRSDSHNRPERIVDNCQGIEVSIRHKDNFLHNAKRLLAHTSNHITHAVRSKNEPPTFEEAYRHLKAKLIDGSPFSQKETGTPLTEPPVVAVIVEPDTRTLTKMSSSAFYMSPCTPNKLESRSNMPCRNLFDGPLIVGDLCGAGTPDSLRSRNFIFSGALKACREPELSPSASILSPDDNSLLDDGPVVSGVLKHNVDTSKVTNSGRGGIRGKLGNLRRRVAGKHDRVNGHGETVPKKRTIPLILPLMRQQQRLSGASAGTKGSKTVEARNPPQTMKAKIEVAAGERNILDTPITLDGRGPEKVCHKAQSRPNNETRTKELSAEKKKKLKYFEYTVERRLEADKALLQAIKAKMASSPRSKKRHGRRHSMLEQLGEQFDIPTTCGKNGRGDATPGFVGTLGEMLACANTNTVLLQNGLSP
ncbi:hypothetical protein MPSEU_000893100 [Mayamaea pseudoterrestris]|nr:hypothetical protein MPSEU_000893100 [Mayamaea pseudoterrestris]